MNARRIWTVFRRVWITTGVAATVVLVSWSLLAYRAGAEGREASASDGRVTVTHANAIWHFVPTGTAANATVGLLFFPGALVDPIAYAPLARAVAMAGYPVLIVELPRRGAFGAANNPALLVRALDAMRATDPSRRWVVAGHSKGAVVASALASVHPERVAGLALIGTTHPRDVDLSALPAPVTKIVGTHDGIAPIAGSELNRRLLPPSTRWVTIDGGNHSQFGWYGFQPGDHVASISRASQHAQMIDAVLELLRRTATFASPDH